MKLLFEIPKKKYTIIANNLNDAINKLFMDKISSGIFMFCFSSKYGNHYQTIDHSKHRFYTVQIYKRGEHKENKRYEFYVYSLPKEMFEFVKVTQEKRTFKIEYKNIWKDQ